MKIKTSQLQQVFESHVALDGSDRLGEKAGAQGTDKVIRVPYKFAGSVRLTIARNMRALKEAFEDYDKARAALVRQHAPDGKEEIEPNTPEMKAFAEAHKNLWDSELDLPGVKEITEADLDLDKNTIPPTVLAGLFPVFQ